MAAFETKVVSAKSFSLTCSATLVVARTRAGEIGIMAGHEPLLAALVPGPVKIFDSVNSVRTLKTGRGFLCMNNNVLEIVASDIEVDTLEQLHGA